VRNDAFGGRCVFEGSARVLAERPGTKGSTGRGRTGRPLAASGRTGRPVAASDTAQTGT
jgi:hypothetical protein